MARRIGPLGVCRRKHPILIHPASGFEDILIDAIIIHRALTLECLDPHPKRFRGAQKAVHPGVSRLSLQVQ